MTVNADVGVAVAPTCALAKHAVTLAFAAVVIAASIVTVRVDAFSGSIGRRHRNCGSYRTH
eukprot:2404951-Lingulodinium_polyedra.AAC.1